MCVCVCVGGVGGGRTKGRGLCTDFPVLVRLGRKGWGVGGGLSQEKKCPKMWDYTELVPDLVWAVLEPTDTSKKTKCA